MPTRRERTGGARERLDSRPLFRPIAALAILLPVLLLGTIQAHAKGGKRQWTAPYRDGIVLMAFRDGVPREKQKAIFSKVGAREIKQIGVGVHVLKVKPGSVMAAIHSLEAIQAIQYAEPDYLQTVSASGALPNDSLLGFQWAVHNTGQTVNGSSGTSGDDEKSPLAWGITTGTNSVVIAELDTGVQYSHPDLITNIWNNPGGIGGCAAGTHGYNVLTSTCDPMDDDNAYSGHGTHVAGIMGAVGNDAAGTVGVNWTTSIMALKWVNSGGTGATSDLITAMDWVVSAKQAGVNVRVVNDSQTWAGTAFSQSLSNEIDTLGSNDILFVTASGNTAQDNDTTPRYPCSYDRPLMICVAASDQNDHLWGSANYGPNSVQLVAPGVNIYSTLRTSNYGYISGGSMASPQVAGTAALILSLGYQPVATLRSLILNNVDVLSSLSGFVGTSGRLNVCKAVPGCSTATSATPANTTAPVVTSLPIHGGLLGASTGVWSGLPTTYTYQWSRCSSSGTNCVAIPGATGQTYALLAPADSLATLAVTVTGSNSLGSASVQSTTSGAVTSANSSSALNSSIVSGTLINGSVAWTVTPSRSEQFVQFYVDGVLMQTDTKSPFTYNGSTTGLFDTTTLPNGTHVLGARALFTDNKTYDFYGENVTVSNPPQNTVLPAISGTLVPGQTISVSNGTWNPNTAPTGFSYQWEHCDSTGLNCSILSSAISSTYLLSGADTNFTMRAIVTASNAGGSTPSTTTQTGVVPPPPLTITTSSLPGAIQNTPYSTTVTATGGVPPYTWSISSGALPAGITMAPATGVISGTTASTGTTNFTVQVSDSRPVAVTMPLSLTVAIPLGVTTTSLPNGTQLASYSTTLAAIGGTPPYAWSIVSGALPNGISLAPGTGVISGTTTTAGTSNITVQVTDAHSLTSNQPLALTINGVLGGTSGIGLVQANSAQGTGVPSVSAAFPISNTAGNLIVAFVRMSSGTQTVSITDTAGNAYLQAVAQVQNADGSQSQLFFAKNILGAASNTVTATFSATNNHPWLAFYEFQGLSKTNPLDQVAATQGNSSTPTSGPSPTTTNPTELIFGGTGLASTYTGTQTAGAGFTLVEADTASSPGSNEIMLATSTGSYTANFSLSASPNWSAVVATFAAAPPPGPTVTTSSLPNGTQNNLYSATLAAINGALPYTWSISSGALPAGLTLAPSTGVISGSPTGTGTTSFTVMVTDAASLSATMPLSITDVPPPSVITTSLPGGTQNVAYNTTLAATGGTTPYTWSVSVGSLPAGLILAPGTGLISGSPTGTGTTSFTVQVADANSVTASQSLSITIVPPPSVTTTSLINGTQNNAYNATLAATGGTSPYTWSVSVGSLPAGLTLAPSIGVISGTPTSTGTTSFTLQVTDSNSVSATKALSITVVAAPSVITTSFPNGTQNATYSATLAATGGTTPYTWAISVGSLPAGLSLAPSTGAISGTPTAAGTTSFIVQVTDANSAPATKALSVTVAPPPSVTTAALPNGTQNVAYSITLAATGGTTPYIWSISVGSLPTGLSLAPGTGVISGTPTATGTTSFTVQVTDVNLATATQPLSITIVPPPSVTTTSLPNATQNAAYNTTLAATGGTTPYTWAISVGSLPAGLSLAPGTGVISGTPTSTGTVSFTVQVTDANSQKATHALSVTTAPAPGVTNASLPNGTQNAAYNATLAATGGTTPYTWAISVGSLPAGLSLAPSTGAISGTPTAAGTTGFTVQVTDANSASATKSLSITVALPPSVTTASLPSGTQNVAYSTTLVATGGTTPYTWSISVGSLPAGLSLAPGTGVISGTVASTGTTSFTVQVTDVNSATATQPLSITIVPPPSVTTTSLASGTQNSAYSATLAATGGTTPYTWAISVGSLPAGLTLTPSTGVISGTPTVFGTINFTVQVTDANSQKATQPLSITLATAPGVSTTSLPNGTQNAAYSATLTATGGTTPYTWAISVGSLPAGLTLTPSTGAISGTPTGTGTTGFTVQVTDANSVSATKALSITVVPPPSITTTSLPNGSQGLAYSSTLAATGGTTPYTWSVSVGSLPAGLTLTPSTGTISGTPTGTGTTSFTVQVTDANSQTATQALSIFVAPPPLTVTTASLPNGTQNTTYTATLAAVGGTPSYTWSVSVGTLPAGLILTPSTGQISGAPTGTGTTSFTVQVTDSNSQTATKALSINVVPPPSVTTTSLPNASQNVLYSTTLAATGGTTPYTWSVSVGSFPTGLSLAAGTGVISGTPTVAGTTSFTVQVTDANSVKASMPLSITVVLPPSITTASLPNGTQNLAYSTTLAATGGTTPYTWSVSVGSLPAGLVLTPGTGAISGTPTGTGTTSFTIQVTDTNSLSATRPLSITIVPPPSVTTASLPNGTQNAAYSATLAAVGGTTPYTWSISVGSLPAGLTLAPSTGVISGTPTATGTTSFTVQVTDANSLSATKLLSINVVLPPSITTVTLPNGTQNSAYSTTLAATGGTTPYTWSVSVGTLPTGLTLAPSTGVISGTPTVSGTISFTVQVADANSQKATQSLSITLVTAPAVTTTSLPNGTQNAAYNATLAASGGTTPYTWSISVGALPAGLALAPSTGAISGTPTGTGTTSFTVQVTDANSLSATKPLSITVVLPLSVTTTSLPNATQNTAYSQTLAATGGTTPYTWSISAGSLPAGLSLAPGTGVISGTPTGAGTAGFTVQVTDANSLSATKPLSITISSSSGGGIGLVQANAVQGSGIGSLSVAFPAANTAGNLILAFVRMSTSSQTVTLTDSAGNSYVQAVGQVQSSDGSQVQLFYAKNILGAANTVKATFSASNGHPWLSIYEYKGLSGTNPLDQTAHAQGNSSVPNSGATPATTSANELVFAGIGLPSSYPGTQTVGSGYTIQEQDTVSSRAANESMLTTTTGSFSGTFSLSASTNWSAIVATFAAAAAPSGPAITTTSLPNGTQNAAYSATLSATGGTTPYTWSISSGSLPAGLSLAPGTGVISGTPTGTGTTSFTLQVIDVNSQFATQPLSITIVPPPSVTTTSLPNGTQGTAYSATLAASGGTTPYTWSITVGSLPAGLSLAPGTGVISGTPTGNGTTSFTVQVMDANSQTAAQPLSINVLAPPLTVTTSSLPNGTQNAAYSATLAAIGGTTPFTWSVSVGALPAGLSLAPSTGVISGTPIATGTTSFTAQVTDANSLTAIKPLSITVVLPPSITTTSLPSGTQNSAYSTTLAATGGTTPYTWSVSVGSLPAGLTLAASTGIISGTPTVSGTISFTVQVTDANSQKATQALSITLAAAPGVTTSSLPNGTQNVAYTTTLAASGGTTPYTWSISVGSLPAGLSLAPSTGVISGTPTATGTTSFTVQVTDANSLTATKALSIIVVPPPSITTASLPNGTQNTAYSTTLAATGGTIPYTWSVSVGSLPTGLTLAPGTGVISGTPTATGTTSFTVQVTDSNSQTAVKPLSITINASSGTIALVQQNAVQGSAVPSLSVAFPSANTAGNLIIAFVRMSTSTQTVALTDSAGNVYTQAVTQAQTTDGSQVFLFYAKSIKGAANTVTATFSATNNHPWLAIYEYKGLNAINPLDQTAHAQGNSGAPNSGATPVTTSANELVFAAMGMPATYSGTQAAGIGYAFLQQDTSTSVSANESVLATATGSFSGTFTVSPSANWSAIVATFKQ